VGNPTSAHPEDAMVRLPPVSPHAIEGIAVRGKEMTIMRKTIALTTAALVAATVGLGTGTASASAKDVRVAADLNGDGVDEQVTVRAAGTADQQIVTTVDGQRHTVSVPADTLGAAITPRVTDIDGNGAEELVLTEYVGANTDTFGVWAYMDGALYSFGTDNGDAVRLYEGGGVSARSGYTCEEVGGVRQLVVLSARIDDDSWDDPTYTGSWTYYRVEDGTASPSGTEVAFTSVGADSPLLAPDSAACAS
jgi:hypothetical protein